MKIFIGGSRKLKNFGKLDDKFISLFYNDYICPEYKFIVGDANGADKVFQKILNDKSIKDVTVYFSKKHGKRNKLNNKWKEISVKSHRIMPTDFDERHVKDYQMVIDANMGIMYWNPHYINRFDKDSISKGSILNIYNLLISNKKCILFDENTKNTIEMNKLNDLLDYLKKFYPNDFNKLNKIFHKECENFSEYKHSLKNDLNDSAQLSLFF